MIYISWANKEGIFLRFVSMIVWLFHIFQDLQDLYIEKNSKVFEQKGDLLNFKANIDPMAVLSQVIAG